jgi:class 3 adenylate cyclase/tetratricopeptide (TPR) repeat protein
MTGPYHHEVICGRCGHENREGAKFCGACGSGLAHACTACGTTLEEDERFCTECGAPVTSPGPSSPAAVPTGAERKHITVLFADVAGSMDLQEQLDAEVWAGIMSRFVGILAEGITKYGGTVDKFTGDGVMALFGAPVAQEDHARRACHAAWHLTNTIGTYSEDLRGEQGVELHVRLGLNSGEVVVGRVGADVTLDPTALGHTVGLAQRMEAMARPGTAYLTEHTARLVESWFRLDDLGPTAVKGARGVLRVFELGAPMSHPRRTTVGAAPLVGRGREMAVLEEALAMATEGQFQVVGVVGEAGVGKSRLCEEFARSVSAQGISVRRAVGVSYGQDVPLLPILAFQREYFGITEADDAAAARRKITDRLLELDPGLHETLPLMFDFLDVPDPDHPVPPMAPEVRMRRVFDIVRRMTARRSERETLVLILEDLHWFDPQSAAFVERLIESYPGSRSLVVTNFRPEFSARWMRHSYYRQLPLAPLREQAVSDLLGGLLGLDLSLAPLVAFVLERTGGNPFFVEEIVRALIEDGTLAGSPGNYRLTRPLHEIRVPSSVQALLAARIDRLPAEQKAVLETAAVIGRTFNTAILAQVAAATSETLLEALAALCAAELLQETDQDSYGEYRFWHPLTQEVAYGSLLTDRRRRVHAAVAEALAVSEPDRLDELAAVLAWHWAEAGHPLEAARWNMRAGNWAMRSDLAEAHRRWQAAVDLAGTVEDDPEALRTGVQARGRLLQFGARTGMAPEEADRLFRDGKAVAERLGHLPVLARFFFYSGASLFFGGDLSGARARYLEAIRLAEEAEDHELPVVVALPLTAIAAWAGPLTEALEWFNRAVKGCAGDLELGTVVVGYSVLARTLQIGGCFVFGRAGRLVEAKATLQQSFDLIMERPEPDSLAWAFASVPLLAWATGEGDDLVAHAEKAVALGEETGNVMSLVLGLEALALAHLAAGCPEPATAACDRALAEARRHGTGRLHEVAILSHLAGARLGAGDPAAALSSAEEAIAVARRQGARVVECLALLARARARRALGRALDADADLAGGLALVEETGALTYAPFLHEERARLHNDEKELDEALRLYRQIGATGHARRVETEL